MEYHQKSFLVQLKLKVVLSRQVFAIIVIIYSFIWKNIFYTEDYPHKMLLLA